MDVEALKAGYAAQTPDGVMITDAQGSIVFWNEGCTRIFGFTQAEAMGQSIDIIIPEGLRARHWHGWDQTMQRRSSRYGAGDLLSVPALRKDGARISVEFSILPFKDATGAIIAVGATFRDATQRFEELKQLRKLRQATGSGA